MTAAFAFVFGYLLGSIPFGLLLTRAAGGPDIRAIGSGNIGATNVLRTGNKVLAAATLLCDMAPEAIADIRAMLGRNYGKEYVPASPREYHNKSKNAQEAHEAVRPTSASRTPAEVAKYVDRDQARLYELIWNRAVASQMESAELERTTVDIVAKAGSRNIELRASGQVVKFDGFLTLYQEGQDETPDDDESRRLPAMSEGETLSKQAIESSQHFTEPPPRFSEAALVKRMAKAISLKIKLVSSAGTGHYYVTRKNSRTQTDKMKKKKYDPIAKKHVEYSESKIK